MVQQNGRSAKGKGKILRLRFATLRMTGVGLGCGFAGGNRRDKVTAHGRLLAAPTAGTEVGA